MTLEPSPNTAAQPLSSQEQEILRSVRELKYGTVEVTIHDQFIVEVSKREKVRFPKTAAKPESHHHDHR
jgi:hypothetical protein